MNRTALLSVWLVVVFTWLAPVPAHATTRQTLPEAAGTMGEPAHVIANQTDPLQLDAKTVNIELVLDSSASMSERLPEGETRMEAAQRILRQAIDDLPEREGINVGLRVYGHVGDNTEAGRALSCRSSELVVPVSGLDKAALIAQVEAMQPTGWTPIAYSLEQAATDFQPGVASITNPIVLGTEWEE